MEIAVLLTCFNRREKTLSCLSSLFAIVSECAIYLVDDASIDGTAEAVKEQFPKVTVIDGKGDLFWNRGMHLAWVEAAKHDYEYYLWLNDDVVLYEHFLSELMECTDRADNAAIITGLIESQNKDEILYGGSGKDKRLLKPTGKMQTVTYLNGNVVLVPKAVFDVLGPLDPFFHHDLGDVDYGFRAAAKGFSVYTTKSPIAYGEKNPICRERLNGAGLTKRFKRLYSPLGSNPNINFYFRNKHKSIFNAMGYYIFQHILNIIPDGVNGFIFGNKYQ